MKKRLFAAFVCLCMIVSLLPTMAFAEAGVQDSGIVTSASGLCEHHTQHDESCGYTEGTAEIPCSHEHDESCGGLTDPEACNHTHDEACGYVPATEGTPCTYVCEICNAQDSGNPEAPSDAQPEECTCETLCTEEEINGDCPVCSAEGADLDKVCVGAALLLTAPTLRTGEIKLFIGGQQITESGCYENQNGTWTKVDGTEPANGQFSYDAATATLTLNQAKIVNYQDVTVGGGFTYPGSVIAFSQSADVSLTIVVSQGTSNITGTGGIRVVSKAGDASLSISGPGSLEVKNVSNDSGIVLIGSKNVNLGINSADVTISNVQYYGVQLAAGDACKSTATINDGNLTVSDSVVGIYFMRLYTSGPSSLTVSGNAMVDTEGKTGGIINGFPDSFQIGADGESGGIVFNGNSGTVYGNVTLQEDLEIGKDASLTVPDGKTLTNNGTVTTEEGGTLTGNITNAPPKITTTSLSEGTVNTAYNQLLAADNNPTSWSVTNGTLPDGLTLNSDGTITGTPSAVGSSTFTVTATNKDSGSDSKALTLTINPAPILVTGVTLNKSELALYTGGSATLTATVQPDDATNKAVNWSSSNEAVATVDTNGKVTAKAAGEATITATAADGSGKSATCTVTVKPAEYTVTVLTDGKGSASASPSTAAAGTTVTLTADPDNGWRFSRWEVVEGDVTISGNSFIMPAENVTVRAVFSPIVNLPDTYDIDLIVSDGGEARLSLTNASEGSTITVTATPDVGFKLDYITVDGERIDGTTFTMPDHDVTVRVYFTDGAALPFTDVSAGAWYFDAIGYVYVGGLMDGVSDTLFDPDGTMTRAMVWAILARVDGETVTGDGWIETAREWAVAEGVSDGENATDYVTREQLATMLWRYAGEPETDGSGVGVFDDGETVSIWAFDAMSWALNNGVITGVSDDALLPANTATRAQCAAMLMRFVEAIG